MGFEKFGRKSYTAQTKVAEFVDRLAQGEICATRCRSCGRIYFPPRADCSFCLGDAMEWVKIPETGKLASFTRVYYAPAGFEADVPYTLALVNFGDVKVFGRLSSAVEESTIKIGMDLKPIVLEMPDGQITYEFIPVEECGR
ncbi:MAG: Zn-ribbon domain-containing OB-fold protein [Armatimonadetes bacterium]|nr:Zn-ribbon domain-containing OB-fold protein [Armatimonadota bacterium]